MFARVLMPLLTAALLSPAAALAADPPKGSPLQAKWEYSSDGGKTYAAQPFSVSISGVPDRKQTLTARATFTLDDPAKIGGLKILAGAGTGAFALTDGDSVQRRYIGAYPTVLNVRLAVNGKETEAGHFPCRLYNWLTIDPELLQRGPNTLTVSGIVWVPPAAKGPVPGELRLETLPGNLAVLDRGPTLGAIGEDFFSLTARGVTASEFSIAVKPLDPPGEEKVQKFDKARLLRAKVAVPKGTRKFSYALTMKCGDASKVYGPYEVAVPIHGAGLRFIVAANTYIYGHHPLELEQFFAKLVEAKPQFFVHGGVMQNCASHDQAWSEQFFHYSRDALARVPMFAVPGYPDMYSPVAWGQEFYFPTADGTFDYWTQAIGKVRLVGIEALSMTEDNGRGLKWLEDVLKNAREDYVLVFNSQVPNCSGQNAKYHSPQAIEYIAKNVSPLLAKYKVTATIGSYHYVYERSEPPADQSVTTIMTSKAGGLGWPLRSDMVAANKASKVADGSKNHYCLFEVGADGLRMQAVAYETGQVMDQVTFKPRPK